MVPRRLLALFTLFILPASLFAQDAHSFGIGGAATAAPLGIFGVYWNPSMLAIPQGTAWTIASGFSAFDTTNTGLPIVHFNPDDGRQSSQDPVQRFQKSLGLFAVKYINVAGGVVYDQELDYLSSQGALKFFHDRGNGSIPLGSSYNLNYQQTTQQVTNLVLSYGMPLPLGNMQLFTIGGNLKYHDGLQYQQTTLTGTYQQGLGGNYTYTKTTSSSGLGLSMDLGFLAKLTDFIQVGMMFQNIQSNFNWQATQQNYALDSNNGAESPSGPPASVNVSAPFPYATKLGFMYGPPESNSSLEAEITWSQQQARWRFGLDRYYPEANLVVRLGTFADQVSNQQLWCFGVGYFGKVVSVDGSFLTRSIPDLQNSISLGGALDAVVTF